MHRRILGGTILAVIFLSLVLAAVWGRSRERGVGLGEGKIGLIYLTGVIAGEGGASPLFGSTADVRGVIEALGRAEEDPSIKAVVLRIDSPGGSAAASQEISDAVRRVQKAGKKVVVSMGDTAASGAYWVAAGADKIVALPSTITGSIGVIFETANLSGLYHKLGIQKEILKSGPFKDMGSESRPLTPEERAILQGMVDDIYQQFVDHVAQGRHLPRQKVLELADGRVFTGRQAKELGLVDELGDLHTAVQEAAHLAGIKGKPEVVELGKAAWFRRFFGGFLDSLLLPRFQEGGLKS
ncbi:signal peptide peptidase SppA, 36K type [Ammonifex degensii KC4]|uniref:Signal peptide peptidase SppA, 36K type n=1 Tax=Ammonifex degensii (strain DSM 10501 / KC4) TaxID=429009 RepID=C9RAB9_AMMDK|nr:signal peptide peptidase SppA [Ammonifex degensii]ACX51228.1 signal peptide peptidase SppA, 36K type [Ammonifex degensii KC4]